jgi:hypothetical protein
MKVGIQSVATPSWTLAGNPGSVESVASVAITPPEAGTATLQPDGAALIDWALPMTGVTVSFTGDNIAGEVVGELTITSDPFDVLAADTVLADAGTVSVA